MRGPLFRGLPGWLIRPASLGDGVDLAELYYQRGAFLETLWDAAEDLVPAGGDDLLLWLFDARFAPGSDAVERFLNMRRPRFTGHLVGERG